MTSGEVAKANAKWVDKEEKEEGKGENLLGKPPPSSTSAAAALAKEDEDDDSVVVRANNAKTTMIFLHGFGDTAPQWEAFARTLVRGMEEYVDVVLPSAPKRYYATNANEDEDEEETSSSGGNGKKTARQRRRIIQRPSVVCAEVATESNGLREHISGI